MATKPSDKAPTPDEGAHEIDTTRYRVLAGGITSQSGRPVKSYYKGDIVTADELGDAVRIAKLIARKAIEVVSD